jgi:hypothetical protein
MPVAFAFSAPLEIFVITEGDVTFAEVAVLLDELIDDARIEAGTGILVDCRKVVGAPSTPELRLIARDLAPLRDRGVNRIAVCADSVFVYGIARMFAVFAELIGIHVAAFREMEAAKRWLGSSEAAA